MKRPNGHKRTRATRRRKAVQRACELREDWTHSPVTTAQWHAGDKAEGRLRVTWMHEWAAHWEPWPEELF